MPSGVLFVCYANMCRSPLAEGIAATMFGGLSTSSAGTHARDGYPMHPHSATILAERGLDPDRFSSRLLTASIVAGADLVLAAGRRERAACVTLAPNAIRRIFTLRQFGRLAEAAIGLGTPPLGAQPLDAQPLGAQSGSASLSAAGRWDMVLDLAARARGQLQPGDPADDDLYDPIGQPLPAFRQCAAIIEAALAPVAKLLAPH